MRPFSDLGDDELAGALRAIRPEPAPAFAAKLDERAAAGFVQADPGAGYAGHPADSATTEDEPGDGDPRGAELGARKCGHVILQPSGFHERTYYVGAAR